VNTGCGSSTTSTYRSPAGSAARADLALAGQPDAHAVLDAGRHLDGQRPAGADATVTAALAARVLDDRAEAAAARAGAGRHDLAEERALHLLHLAAALAGVAGRRVGARGGAAAVAGRADDGRLERELAVGAEGRLGQVALDAQQRVGALAHAAAGRAAAPAAPPKKASMMSPRPPKPCVNGEPALPGPLDSGSPPRSTTCRFCGSDSTSYAAVTALKRSCAAGRG
jgi:hypothetical protein